MNGVAFTPDSRWLATANTAGSSTSVFDLAKGKELASLSHDGWAHQVAFLGNGKLSFKKMSLQDWPLFTAQYSMPIDEP